MVIDEAKLKDDSSYSYELFLKPLCKVSSSEFTIIEPSKLH